MEPAVTAERAGGGHRLLVAALLVSLALWNIPYGWVLIYPFKVFATWLHESSHALLMLVTGAGVDRLEIFSDTSGLAHPAHGVTPAAQAAISSAGYMGTGLFGALLLVAGRSWARTRGILVGLGLAMGLSAALFVRNPFGVAAIGGGAVALVVIARWAGPRAAAFLVHLLAAQACVNAVLDIRVLFGAAMYVDGKRATSDADLMARVAAGPPQLWASLWLGWSFVLLFVALKLIGRADARSPGDMLRG